MFDRLVDKRSKWAIQKTY